MALKAPVQTTTIDELPLITGEELLAVGDIGPCELREGRVVYMTPTGVEHGRIEGFFYRALHDHVRQAALGQSAWWARWGSTPGAIPDTVRAADVLYVST